jgi:hypothetical protein
VARPRFTTVTSGSAAWTAPNPRKRHFFVGVYKWRGIATRYEKRAVNCRAAVVITAIRLWLDD